MTRAAAVACVMKRLYCVAAEIGFAGFRSRPEETPFHEAKPLFAHLSRLKLINRWPLMRNVRTENVSEHSLQVAMVAHALALIKIKIQWQPECGAHRADRALS